PCQEYHGQRLARTLRMPHHTAALGGGFAGTEALDDLAGCAELLIAADHLHAWSPVGVHEYRTGTQDLQQVSLVQHPGNQLLLGVQSFQSGIILRVERFPRIEMLFARSDSAEVGFQPVAANQYQVAIEQPWLAFLKAGGFRLL